MGQIDSVFTFTGKLGNVIGYRRGKKRFVRTRPDNVQLTDATRRAAQRFGVASRKGALIRSAFAGDIDIHCDGTHVNRLTKTILQAGRNNQSGIAGFNFSQYASISKFFSIQPVFTRDGKLHIAAQQLPGFDGINRLEAKLIASRIDFGERRVIGTDVGILYIDMTQPFEGAELSVNVPGKGTLVVTMQVRGCNGQEVSGNRKYLAADILAVINPETKKVILKTEHPHKIIQQLKTELAAANEAMAIVQRE